MNSFSIGAAKRKRLESLSTPAGTIAALAMDHRRTLRKMMAGAAGTAPGQIAVTRLAEFKAAVTQALSGEESAILLDPEYGLEAVRLRAPGCGLLLTYEVDGYENPRPNRMLALMPGISARRLGELGADGIKILLSYAPDDRPAVNEEKHACVERIGYECETAGIPFFLEPVVYDPAGGESNSVDVARAKPARVVRTMREFSKEVYRVDVLKVEFPVSPAAGFSTGEALDWYRRADAASRRPYIYLSAGVSAPEFLESLRMAVDSGSRFSGVLCGRANWQDGVAIFVREGRGALDRWLGTQGLAHMRAVNECLRTATPWRHWLTA